MQLTVAVNGASSLAAGWTVSTADLKNSQPDPLIESLLEPTAADVTDANNRTERSQNRQSSIFALFPAQSEVVSNERMPSTYCSDKLLVVVHNSVDV